jgi:hypothetical protein
MLRMNSYTTSSLIYDTSKQPGFLYALIPLFIGIILDVAFTQVMGSQFCHFDQTTYVCNIHGIRTEQWIRETVRSGLQLGLIMCLLLFIQSTYPSISSSLYTSLFGITGLILLFVSQSDLFSDFRRLVNGLVFSLKHY